MSITADNHVEIGPGGPQEQVIVLEDDHILRFTPYEWVAADATELLPPLQIEATGIPDSFSIPDGDKDARDRYIDTSEQKLDQLWGPVKDFIAQASEARAIDTDEYIAHFLFRELIQNAFRYGKRPLNVWAGVVRSRVDRQTDQQADPGEASEPVTPEAFRVLIAIRDENTNWVAPEPATTESAEDTPEHLYASDVLGSWATAKWYQPSDDGIGKWVCLLI